MSRISLRKSKKDFERFLSKRNRKPDEIRIEQLKKSIAGKLLIESEGFEEDKIDLKRLCSRFNICEYINNGNIETPGGMYDMYDSVCKGNSGNNMSEPRCSKYQKP